MNEPQVAMNVAKYREIKLPFYRYTFIVADNKHVLVVLIGKTSKQNERRRKTERRK